jgi:uncharacterized protein (DUF1015 family)
MARIIPFKAVRPPRDKVHLVASRSYLTYKTRHLNRKLNENPYSFIHIINPEFKTGKRSRPNSDGRFKKVKGRFGDFMDQEILKADKMESFYVYRQITPDGTFTGVICGVHVEEYLNGHIKKHEQTLTSRVEVFTRYLDICDFNAEPVLLTYRDHDIMIGNLLATHMAARPDYDFTTTDKVRHKLWPISKPEDLKAIQAEFSKLEYLYIADGHHRMASSAHLGELRRQRPGWKSSDISNFALAFVIPEKNLSIEPFHRVLTLEAPVVESELIAELEKYFEVQKKTKAFYPANNGNFGMRLPSGWYSLELKEQIEAKSPVEGLDPMVITKKILEPIFGIHDQKTDRRITFVPGNQPIGPHEESIDQGNTSVLFTLHPVSTDQLFEVSDASETMPPKSTFIQPKLRSGLTIMQLSEK